MTLVEVGSPGRVQVLRCSDCGACTRVGVQAAVFALGWRVWSGYTVSGQWREVCRCPGCAAAVAEPQPDQPRQVWGVRCLNCGWEHDERDDDGRVLTEADADQVGAAHVCEPWIDVVRLWPPQPPPVVTVMDTGGRL